MIGLRCLLESPRLAILLLVISAVSYAISREASLETLGEGGMFGAALVSFVAVSFGRWRWLVFLLILNIYLAALLATPTAYLLGWNGFFQKAGAAILILALLILGLRLVIAIPVSFRARTIVAVPRKHAFDQAIPHVTSTYWKPTRRRIEALAGEASRFGNSWWVELSGLMVRLISTNRYVPEGAHMAIEISDVVPNERFTISIVPNSEGNLERDYDEIAIWTFVDHPMGTEVQTEIRLRKAKIFMYLVGILVEPQIDDLRQFKATLEGKTDVSVCPG